MFKYKYDELINPVLKALHALGGSGSNSEIEEQLVIQLNLKDDEIEDIHRGNTTKLAYRTAWARNYLKQLGLIENSSRAVWALTAEGTKTFSIDPKEAKKTVQNISIKKIIPSRKRHKLKNPMKCQSLAGKMN